MLVAAETWLDVSVANIRRNGGPTKKIILKVDELCPFGGLCAVKVEIFYSNACQILRLCG